MTCVLMASPPREALLAYHKTPLNSYPHLVGCVVFYEGVEFLYMRSGILLVHKGPYSATTVWASMS